MPEESYNSLHKKVGSSEMPVYRVSDCSVTEQLSPCTIVIFGASGDLTSRKLIPALFNLFCNQSLPTPFTIVGCSRSQFNDDQFRTRLWDFHSQYYSPRQELWAEFSKNLFYHPVDYRSQQSFVGLADHLKKLDKDRNTHGNRIFYLAVPPSQYPLLADMIGQEGLSLENSKKTAWSRIVVEKPFGHDLKSALDLDRTLHNNFQEHQIFRIDHYLAKETVQNVLMFRFANTIFEPIWNRSFIDYVGIIAAEELGVEHRAGYYEQAGILRDMFQNHMKQLLALTAMEAPSQFSADLVRDEKVKVFRSLKPLTQEEIAANIQLGQYAKGVVNGVEVPGYRDEPGIDPESQTPTFAVLRMFIDNWRWKGIPFYVASGKRLQSKLTKIVVQFKNVPHSMFRDVLSDRITANRLTLGVYPEEHISLTFQTKSPGARVCLRTVTMDFNYSQNVTGPLLDAYEKVLLDCILGDHMLFWRQDGVELAWSYLDPILNVCEECGDQKPKLHFYNAGSWGPEVSRSWMNKIIPD